MENLHWTFSVRSIWADLWLQNGKGFLIFVKYREVLKFKENIPTQKGLNLWLYSSKLFHQVIYDFCDVYCSADCRKVCCIMTMMIIQT